MTEPMVALRCIRCGGSFERRKYMHDMNTRRRRDGPFCSRRCAAYHHPNPVTSMTPEKFWARVDTTSEGCWPWVGARNSQGYGHFRSAGKDVRACRYAYEAAVGPIPDGLQILHRCDNPPCVRPDHLSAGSQQDNVRDMIEKGRGRWATDRAAELMDGAMG